jgi:hypothetical protein
VIEVVDMIGAYWMRQKDKKADILPVYGKQTREALPAGLKISLLICGKPINVSNDALQGHAVLFQRNSKTTLDFEKPLLQSDRPRGSKNRLEFT